MYHVVESKFTDIFSTTVAPVSNWEIYFVLKVEKTDEWYDFYEGQENDNLFGKNGY